MIDIILPGYSDKNKVWLESVASELKTENEVRTIYWNHWSDFHKKFDPKDKAIDVIDVMLDDSANLIAKSVGTLVASYVLLRAPEKIKKVVADTIWHEVGHYFGLDEAAVQHREHERSTE